MMRGMRMRGGVKPQDVGRTVRRLMSYVARYRLRLMLVAFNESCKKRTLQFLAIS